ncbi:MAG: hypothetical protein WCL30_01370 [Pseudomonadota bacterium]
MNDKYIKIADYIVASFLAMFFLSVLTFSGCLLLNIDPAWKWNLSLFAGLASPLLFLGNFNSPKLKIKAFLLLCGLFLLSCLIAYPIFDSSYDGTTYHADAILLLLKDINPIYQEMHWFDDLWTNHYPKAAWCFSAIIIHLTDNYNLGKIHHTLLIYTVFAYIFSCLARREFDLKNAVLLALAGALSPVAVSQMHSQYVDGTLCSLTTLLIFASATIISARPRNIDFLVLIISSCLLINVKFTGLVYAIVILSIVAIAVFYAWFKFKTGESLRKLKAVFTSFCAIFIFGICIIGYNPYFSNYLQHGHPMYPIMGKDKVDVLEFLLPPMFKNDDYSRVSKLILSVFSKTHNVENHHTANPVLKIPFTFEQDEIDNMAYTDPRIAGWGVLFGGILLLAIVASFNKPMSIAVYITLATILVNPESWWARYAPQLALLPLLLIIPTFNSQFSWQRGLGKVVAVLLIVNSSIILFMDTKNFRNETLNLEKQIGDILTRCGKGKYTFYSKEEGMHYDQYLWHTGIEISYNYKDIPPIDQPRIDFGNGTVYKKTCENNLH